MKNKFDLTEILKFLVGGGTAVLVDFLIYHLLMYFGMDISLSKAMSYIAGAIVGFIINKFWTFQCNKLRLDEIMKYILLYSVSALINSGVNSFILWIINVNWFAFLGATGASTICNFLGQKFFVFKKDQVEKTNILKG